MTSVIPLSIQHCHSPSLKSNPAQLLLLTGKLPIQARAGPQHFDLAAQLVAEEDRVFKAVLCALLPPQGYWQFSQLSRPA